MKKLLNIVSESKLDECGMMGEMPAMPATPPTPPVSMNVSLNAQGIDQIKDLLSLMNKAESPLAPGAVEKMPAMPTAEPMTLPPAASAEPMPVAKEPAGDQMDPLDALVKSAGITMAPKAKEEPKEEPKTELGKVADEVQDMADTLADKNEELANAPDEQVSDIDAVTGSGDDLHAKGKEAPKVNGGGNPFATEGIRAMLDARYKAIKEAKKSKPDFLDMDKDGNKSEPMKKAVKDAKVKEGWDDMMKAVKDRAEKGTGKFDKKQTSTGTQYTRKASTFTDGGEDSDTKKAKQKAKSK